ncbi:MAG TPA: flagellar biosynthetic protein FliO [Candidatus Solibacter sp.]|nr:flagellar biosynthetic protein FliO [Candidatus Solibacter sp.]
MNWGAMAGAMGGENRSVASVAHGLWRALWGGVCGRVLRWKQRSPRRLKLCETLALGERRFVAVVEFEQARFLVGGTAGSLVLLARLDVASGASECGRGKEKDNQEQALVNPCSPPRSAW